MNKPALVVLLAALLTALALLAPQPAPASTSSLDTTCGFTSDFDSWLKKNGYSKYNFARSDVKCGEYGGKSSSLQKSSRLPIVFIHGNSDIGFGRGSSDGYVSWQTGFRSLIEYLGEQGYKKSDMYTITWGPHDPNKATQNHHTREWVTLHRAFLQAVLAYTGASQVNVISHSMGVTIARKVVKGGQAVDQAGSYDAGSSLTSKVKNFIGLAGANLGLNSCYNGGAIYPTCSIIDGFNPGSLPSSGPSKYLADLKSGGKEADHVYVIWSKMDSIIGIGASVWGKITCQIPNQDGEVVKNSYQWDHFAIRDKTGPDLIGWLK